MGPILISLALLSLLIARAQAICAGSSRAPCSLAPRYPTPPMASTWEYSLGYRFRASNATSDIYFYSVDLFDTSAADIAAATAAGHYIACYFSAGSFEDWRPDASKFPPASKGKDMDGWPGEKWVDITNARLRSKVMAPRIALAKKKGCMAIDPDNTNGWSNGEQATGFDLTKRGAIEYIRWLCAQARSHGLACGLKNNGEIVTDVLGVTDFAIVEQCVQYNECNGYAPYIGAGKPVYHVEYTASEPAIPRWKSKACASGGNTQFSTIIKHQSLNAWRESCLTRMARKQIGD